MLQELQPIEIHVQFHNLKIYVCDIVIVSQQRLLLCDYFKEVVLLVNTDLGEVLSVVQRLAGINSICMIQDDLAALALARDKEVQNIKVKDDRMKLGKSVKVSGIIASLDAINDTMAVLYTAPLAAEVISLMGKVIHRTDNKTAGKEIFKYPEFLTVSPDLHHIFINDSGTKAVSMLNTELQLLKNFPHHNGLTLAYRMAVFDENQLLVTDYTNKIVHLDPCTGKMTVILDEKDGLDKPSALAYCHETKTLYVVNGTTTIKRYRRQ